MLLQRTQSTNPGINELNTASYRLIAELEHEQIIPFVQQYSKKANLVNIPYWVFSILLVGWIGASFAMPFDLDITKRFGYFLLGFICFIVILLPIHEVLHGAVYKLLGAKRVLIKVQWRQMVVVAIADRFVVNTRQFYWLALTPFIVINTSLIILWMQAGEVLQFVILGALFMHTAGCSGDFAFCSFFWQNRNQELYTYDEYDIKKSYFFSSKR